MPTISVVEMPTAVRRYGLVVSFLELRRQIFVEKLDWPLYSYEKIEFEQYDTFNAVYIIAHEGPVVLGGARLIRTDSRVGTGRIRYSYMIRDAYNGLLPGMPKDLCYQEPPVDPATWELTRLATRQNTDVAGAILDRANEFLAHQGGRTCLFLGPPAFLRMAKSMDYKPDRLGPIVKNDDGSFLAFSCDVIPDMAVRRSAQPKHQLKTRAPLTELS
ncbi:MAG: acyl-homoserine-lactone synthase [Pseudomonadota bacterium]